MATLVITSANIQMEINYKLYALSVFFLSGTFSNTLCVNSCMIFLLDSFICTRIKSYMEI